MLDRLRAYLVLGSWALGLGLLGPICIPLTVLTGREEFITYAAAAVIRFGFLISGIRVDIVGRERIDPNGVYVYAANHQSNLDPAILWLYLGSRHRKVAFLVKKEIKRVPILGYGVMQIGMLVVDRANSERAIDSARRATERIRAGRSFAVYAEGTRTRDGRLLPFKKGAFHMAVDAQVPVVPVSIDGAFAAMPPGSLRLRAVPICVTLHEPIPTAGLTAEDVPALVDRARSIVATRIAAEVMAGASIDSPQLREI